MTNYTKAKREIKKLPKKSSEFSERTKVFLCMCTSSYTFDKMYLIHEHQNTATCHDSFSALRISLKSLTKEWHWSRQASWSLKERDRETESEQGVDWLLSGR